MAPGCISTPATNIDMEWGIKKCFNNDAILYIHGGGTLK
jgi:hypothetical protein